MKEFVPYFKEHFYQKLLTPNGSNPVRNRADGFLKIFEILDRQKNDPLYKKDTFHILETGCMRPDHGDLCYGDDGVSSFIFDTFVNEMGGAVVSVDIDPINVEYTKSKVSDKTRLYCDDSVSFISKIPAAQKFDLLYLDSFDIHKDNPHPSQLHHLMELAAVMKNTKPGTIIAVDDQDAFFDGGIVGKGTYVKIFMERIGAKLIHNGYQIIWELT